MLGLGAFFVLGGGYLVFFDGWKDVLLGRAHRKAIETFSKVDGVDRVEIFLLRGGEIHRQERTFPVGETGRRDPIYGSVSLEGVEVEEFLGLWKMQRPDLRYQSLCHDPPYGFRLYREGKEVVETAICWGCMNFSVEVYPFLRSSYGLDATTDEAKALLEFCDALLPYAMRDQPVMPGPPPPRKPGPFLPLHGAPAIDEGRRDELLSRIEEGRKRMVRVGVPFHGESPVSNADEALQRWRGNAGLPSSYAASYIIDVGDGYAISGFWLDDGPSTPRRPDNFDQDLFHVGYLVKKDDGRMLRWEKEEP